MPLGNLFIIYKNSRKWIISHSKKTQVSVLQIEINLKLTLGKQYRKKVGHHSNLL